MCRISQKHSGSKQSAVMERPAPAKVVERPPAKVTPRERVADAPSVQELEEVVGPKIDRREFAEAGPVIDAEATPVEKSSAAARQSSEPPKAAPKTDAVSPAAKAPPAYVERAGKTGAAPAPAASPAAKQVQEKPPAAAPTTQPPKAAPRPEVSSQPAKPLIRGPQIVSGPRPGAAPSAPRPVPTGPAASQRPQPAARPGQPPSNIVNNWREGLDAQDLQLGERVIAYLGQVVKDQEKYPRANFGSSQWERTEQWKAQVVSRLHEMLFGEPLSTYNLRHGGMREKINVVRKELVDLFGGARNVPRLPGFM